MISLNLERVFNGFNRQFIPHLCNAEFATVPNRDNHVLVRVRQDRRLAGQTQSLYTYLNQQPSEATYTVDVPADPRVGRTAREALLIPHRAVVKIQRPDKLSALDYPASVTLYALEAIKVNQPLGQEPIHWRLLTTHQVVCLEQALCVIVRSFVDFITLNPPFLAGNSLYVYLCVHRSASEERGYGLSTNSSLY